jgi:anti-sigma factor RsiW
MHCNEDATTLAQYLDGELSPDQASTLQQHIGECPRCAAEVSELVALKRSLRAARARFTPSAEFRRKVQQQIAKPQQSWWRTRFVLALATATVFLVVASVLWIQHSRRTDSFSEVADLHVGALASANPVDVVSTDRHTVKPWFQNKIPFSFNIPELTGTEFALLGGRLVYLHQQPGAQLIFNMRKHEISVLIFQKTAEIAHALPTGSGIEKRNSFSVETFDAQELRFVVIGDADANEIRKLALMIKVANE